jgi:ABC-type multidrug transport system ATPase subunit
MTLKNRGRIVIVASHSFPLLYNFCDKVWALSGGQVVKHSNKRDFRSLFDHASQSGSSYIEEVDIPWILELE